MVFELHPDAPIGTTFLCRFRARFTNCSNCWQDELNPNSDDFLDFEYAGDRPYRMIDWEFTIGQ
jgi:hypothetical protein